MAALAHLLTWLLPGGVLRPFAADAAEAAPVATVRARWAGRVRVAAPGGFWAAHSDFGSRLAGGRAADLIGADRASDMVVNILAPFFVAWGSLTDDAALVATACAVYTDHPPLEDNQITRAMTAEVFGPRARGAIKTACQQQGLIYHHGRTCAERRVVECPLSGVRRGRVNG